MQHYIYILLDILSLPHTLLQLLHNFWANTYYEMHLPVCPKTTPLKVLMIGLSAKKNRLLISFLSYLFYYHCCSPSKVVLRYLLELIRCFCFAWYNFYSLVAVDLLPFESEITNQSTPFSISLANHLHSIGAKMYGAFWCSHCLEQKEVHFGI